MEREELLQRILDAPDDDRPRQVLADWLLERGDPRGTFIALQCEAARATDRERRRDLQAQATALLEQHREAWTPKGLPRDAGVFQRGFLDDVSLGPEGFEAHWAALERTTPVRRLQLWGLDGAQLARFLGAPGATRLAQLDLSRTPLGDEGAQALAAAPALRGVRRLTLYACELGPDGVGALARSPHLAALEALDLSGNRLGNGALVALATSPAFPALREPRLHHVGARGEALRALEARFGPRPHEGPALWCVELPAWVEPLGLERDGLCALEPGEPVTLGISRSVTITIPSILGGRKNCSVTWDGTGTWLQHLGHSLPIFVNRRAVQSRQLLQHGDSIEMPYRGPVNAETAAGRVGVRLVYLDGPRSW